MKLQGKHRCLPFHQPRAMCTAVNELHPPSVEEVGLQHLLVQAS